AVPLDRGGFRGRQLGLCLHRARANPREEKRITFLKGQALGPHVKRIKKILKILSCKSKTPAVTRVDLM
ncbi:hypothetical protein HAX54_012605, partial [Datura stramonium]|nr:hypothetical protein [Datura stramonium]